MPTHAFAAIYAACRRWHQAGVYHIPESQDQALASTELRTMGMAIDTLTEEQIAYSNSYLEGT